MAGTSLPIPQDPSEPQTPISMNNFTVDTIINGAGMLTTGGYSNVTRPDLYRSSCTQPIVSQPYPSSGIPQTVFPPGSTVPVEEMYSRSTWYNTAADVGQTSPLDYQQQTRFDNRSPSCAQSAAPQSFRDSYKAYGY